MTVASGLAGRRVELQLVSDVLTAGAAPVAMLLVGAAGVGKSRLISAAADIAVQANVTVLTGWCLGPTADLPLLPVIDVLRELGEVDNGGLLKSLLAACPPFVRREIVRLMPQLEAPGDEQWPPPGDAWRQQRLLDALRILFAELANGRRAAVVIEDVHWADPTTLEFLAYWLVPGHASGVPLVLTCRTEAKPPQRLADWLERLQRNSRVQRLDLLAMTEAETADQIELLLGRRAPRHLVHDVHERSQGNAFFTDQLMADVRTQGVQSYPGALPAGLTALLLSRTAEVHGAAREVMEALAVCARPLPERTLSRLCGRGESEVRAALRELLARRLLHEPDQAGRHQLLHALLAEAVAGELLPADRQELHAKIAALMAESMGAGVAAEVAAHFREAALPAEELPWRARAGREAEAVFAMRDAAGHWRRVITLWDLVPDAAAMTGLDLAQVYLRALKSAENAGDRMTAAALAEEAVARLAATAGAETAVSLYNAVGHFRALESQDTRALRTAIEIGERISPSPDYIRALLRLARERSDQGHPEEERPLMTRAYEAAERAGFVAEQKSLLAELAWLSMVAGSVSESLAAFDRASRLIPDPEDPAVEALVASLHCEVLLQLGRLEQMEEMGVRTIRWAERRGMADSARIQNVRCNLGLALIERGEVDRSARVIDPVTEQTPTPNAADVYLIRADLDTRRGRLVEAAAWWTDHADVLAPDDHPRLRYEAALRRLELGCWQRVPTQLPVEGLSILEQYCRTDMAPFASEMFVLMLRACADAAARARATNDGDSLESALQLGTRLAELAVAGKALADRDVPTTQHANLSTWQAEAGRLRGESDADAWQRSVQGWDVLGRPHRAAYARWRQAEAILARGQNRMATSVLRAAAAQSGQHVPLFTAIGNLARRARIELIEPELTSRAEDPTSRRVFGLTPREMTVLQLLGRGKTNPEIGTMLFISPRTASVHVTNILRKLDVSTRVEAATMAERAGLLDI